MMKLVYIFTILGLSLAEEYQQAKIGILPVNVYQAATTYIPPSQRLRDWQSYQAIKAPIPWVPQVQNDYYGDSMIAPEQASTTTTPVPVIKNEFYMGDNGDYKYEYQIADGTSVGEQGYFTDPNQNGESLVKKGWYSFRGADGIIYTVTYWADHTGYHAFGSHLPGGSSGYVENPSQQGSNKYPSQTAAPVNQQPSNPSITTNPTNNPPQQSYNPPQQTYNPPQQTYSPPQQSYNPPQQSYNPPQQSYNAPQQSYNPPQQSYNPPQQSYNQPQQQNYYLKYNV
ncbi:unnamed protein product [Arctia plantaginis]|uniref:Uncharacterized protein n=1 Tax=Arctia plantaginis TaxID=874455 RepID=A0A8S1BCZ1_ARCPL|nr:unnamed protein product [Arctia plantaginis]CAB3260650.1 unnamed protein product [Arctia plantaginis]